MKVIVTAGRDIKHVVNEVLKSLDELSKEALDNILFFDKDKVGEVSVLVGKVQLEVLLDATLVILSFNDDVEKLWSILWGTEK